MAKSVSAPLNIFGARPGPPDAFARSEVMRSRLERYFQLSIFLLLTAGFVAVATTGALDFFSVAFVSLSLLVRGSLLLVGRNVSMPLAWDPYFTFGYVVFYAADFFLFSHGFVSATIHLVLFTMVVKIFSIRRDRDYVYLAVLAFMEVLAASVLTVDSVFLGSFVLFSLLAVNTFVAFEIRRSWTASPTRMRTFDSPGNSAYVARKFSRSLSAIAVGLVLGIVLTAAGIFFVLPRMTAGYLSRFAPRNRIETGFSNDVQLGRIGEIQQSSAVAMHIEIDGDKAGAHDLKWRGVALTDFDGHTWRSTLPRTEAMPEISGCFNVIPREERRPGFACIGASPADRNMIHYRVLMEPIGTSVFFLAPKPLSVSGKYRSIIVDSAGAVYNADPTRAVEIYEATSDLLTPTPEQLRESANFYPIDTKYTVFPSNLDPRVEQLAKKVTASSTNAYDKAVAIERYLQTNYGYTLQLPKTIPRDPVADFLFQRKAGHCEYFASTMAVMLRTIGIPSRLVNGFRGGEFNSISGKYIIRASDAHSWVEVYFPGSGWVSFDPTPAGAGSSIAHNRIALYLDAMRDFWREWIINYDVGHQQTLGNLGLSSALKSIEETRRWMKTQYLSMVLRAFDLRTEIARRPSRWMYLSLLSASLVLLLANIPRIRRALKRRRLALNPGRAPEAAASLWYVRMQTALKRKGVGKAPAQTPQEFTASISDPVLQSIVGLFVKHYERARFANSAADAEKLPSLFESVRVAARRPQAPVASDKI